MDRSPCGAVVRYAAASLTLLALTASIGLFVNRHSSGGDALEQAGGAREQSLHFGANYFANAFGVTGDLNHHWWCGHYFRSLCRRDGRDQTPWYQKTDWLDYSSRLKAAHEADEQEEVAFHEAIKELHARVLAKRNATEHLRQEIARARKANLAAIDLRTQQKEDLIKAVILKEKEKMEAAQAQVNAAYLERIANISTGWQEYQTMLDQARSDDIKRRTEFHELVDHMRSSGASAEQIQSAELEFKKQELGYQSLIMHLKQDYSRQRSIYDKDVQEAKSALDLYRAEAKADEMQTEMKEKSQAAVERTVEDAVNRKFEAKSAAWKKDNAGVHYKEDLKTAGSAEADKVSDFERKIQVMKQQALLRKEKWEQRAKDEVAKEQREASEAKAERPGQLQDAPKGGTKETMLNSAPKPQHAQMAATSATGTDRVLNVLLKSPPAVHVREQQLATAAPHPPQKAVSAADKPWADRRAAFFRAMSAQAERTQAKFSAIVGQRASKL